MASQIDATVPGAIHDAATRLVAREGPVAFTMEGLARESGIPRATLYRQVGSRAALLAAISRKGGPALSEQLDVAERILAAARLVFSRTGFDGAKLEEVAREAGVGTATVYRQFRDKEGLIRAFIDRFSPRRAVFAVTITPTGDLRADLERVAVALLRAGAANRDLIRLAMLERLRGGRWAEVLNSSPMSSHKSITELLRSYAAKGALRSEDTAHLARAFAGMLMASVSGALVTGAAFPEPEQTARFVAGLFLDGAAAPSRRSK